jgi:hypothetical protein
VTRFVQITLVALALGIGGLLLWDAVRGDTSPPREVHPAGQAAPATVAWGPDGVAHLDVQTRMDAARALGVAHAQKRAWPAALWRQTALGRLAAWFGPGLLRVDRHARRLGFARHAREAYRALPPRRRAVLQAYVAGLNAALEANRSSRAAPFVALGVEPAPWEAWHPLALERLFAWLTRPPLALPPSPPPDLAGFAAADGLLRRWLHLHGFQRSLAWAARPGARPGAQAGAQAGGRPGAPAFFHRLVTGSSALPFVQEVSLSTPEGPAAVLATVPGTLLFPGGRAGPRSWGLLLGSPARLQRTAVDTTAMETWHERLVTAGGAEQLATVRRVGARLPFRSPAGAGGAAARPAVDTARAGFAPPDTAWVLDWSGLAAATDLGPMLRLAGLDTTDRPPPHRPPLPEDGFALFHGHGLALAPDTARVVGRPPVVERFAGGVLVGRSPWARPQADALQALAANAGSTNAAAWGSSDSSAWAGAVLPAYLDGLAPIDSSATRLQGALTYLRNWDLRYDRASIGASIFDRWMRAYRRLTGRRPRAADSTFFAPVRRRRALQRAVRALTHRFGTDMRRWRWERVAPDRRAFPVWAADTLVAQDLRSLATTRYAPLSRPGRGHPSTLAGGPSLTDVGGPPATATWNGWAEPGTRGLTVRRLRFSPSAFLARPLLAGDPPAPVAVRPGAPPATARTRLLPRQ